MLTSERIHTIIRNTLKLPENFELDEDMRPASVPGWDSLAWLSIIAEVEDELEREIPLDALDDVSTIGDLYVVLRDV